MSCTNASSERAPAWFSPSAWRRSSGSAACGSSSTSSKSASSSTSGELGEFRNRGSSTGPPAGAPVNVAIELVQNGLAFTQETQAGAQAAAKQFAPTSASAHRRARSHNRNLAGKQRPLPGRKRRRDRGYPPSPWTRELTTAMSQTNGNVVAFNSPPVAGTAKTYVGNSDLTLGQKLASATIKAAHLGPNTTGQVIISNCAPGASLLAVTVKGEVDTVKQLLPKATIEPAFNSEATPSANSTAWQQEISAHPSTVLALGTCDQDGDSMIKAKQSTGGKFAIGASDLDPLVLQGIANGTVAADLAQNWYLEGYTATRMLIDAARNHTTPPAGWFQPGTTVVTKANVATLEKRDASTAGLTAFYKPIVAKFWSNISAAAQSLSGGLTRLGQTTGTEPNVRLEEKRVLITGTGSPGGQGAMVQAIFAREGARIVGCDIQPGPRRRQRPPSGGTATTSPGTRSTLLIRPAPSSGSRTALRRSAGSTSSITTRPGRPSGLCRDDPGDVAGRHPQRAGHRLSHDPAGLAASAAGRRRIGHQHGLDVRRSSGSPHSDRPRTRPRRVA